LGFIGVDPHNLLAKRRSVPAGTLWKTHLIIHEMQIFRLEEFDGNAIILPL
jgi:hypothetical protein